MRAKGGYRQLFDLSGKVAVVTGGAGIIGQEIVAALADHGAAVAVVDLDEGKAKAVAAELAATYEVCTLGVGVDVADKASVVAMADAVERELGPIDVLHNNAAGKGASLDAFFEPLETFDLDTWRAIMAVNLDGMFLVAQAVGSRMAQRGRGSIIQTASIYGAMGPDQRIYEGSEYLGRPINTPPIYSASKAGVIGLTRYLAAYWGKAGVRVNTLTPGGVESGQNERFSRQYGARVPMGRMALAHEMTGAVVYLASDASSYVTGQNLFVDGGLSAW
ncbi:short-chain dehydrogenase [Alsobacter metallidurans]|uniref:Short-chain dehydrogenase n=1 Tax=Alsobacter metallidurans TaxID=340221 RepID=A0A917MH97_9HYPH|nr:SDR family oxidoreductase [Alsobacter metallidurans]GGH15564.1 short-chain dehydrogenase [Alsobacter metallidurans]